MHSPTHLATFKTRITRHRSWLRVEAPLVAEAYDALSSAARFEAGMQMTEAWNSAPFATGPNEPAGRIPTPEF